MVNENKGVSIAPSDFKDEALHDRPFEQAILTARALSDDIPDNEWHETSVRFCVDGLFRWMDDFSQDTDLGSAFYLIRDSVWIWVSYCDSRPEWVDLKQLHRKLTREIANNSSYTDLVDALSKRTWLRNIGRSSKPTNTLIPRVLSKRLSRYCDALGVSFSQLYCIGVAWCLSQNRDSKYQRWTEDKVMPVLAELDELVARRTEGFLEVENTYNFREALRKKGRA